MIIFFFTKSNPDSHGITNSFIHEYLKKRIHCTKIFTEQKNRNAFIIILWGNISLIITLNDNNIKANSFIEHECKMVNIIIANQTQQHINW